MSLSGSMAVVATAVSCIAALSTAAAAPLTPYAGQDSRAIKALSAEEIADLRAGRGKGLARAAELNGYPGPLHVIEHAEALALSDAQLLQTKEIFDAMKVRAIAIGEQLIGAERELEALFQSRQASRPSLSAALSRIGALQAELRATHLQAHLDQVALLEPVQLARYAQLRGYRSHASPSGHGEPAKSHD